MCDELDRETGEKAAAHDYWKQMSFDLLEKIVKLKMRVAHLEWRETFLENMIKEKGQNKDSS